MISLQLKLYIVIVLAANSRGFPSTDQIPIDKNFRISIPYAVKPELPPLLSNFVFNPQLLLGSFVPPQIGAFVTKFNETPVSENSEVPEIIEPNEGTPTPYSPITIDESIVVRSPFPPREKIEIHPVPILLPLEIPKITTIPRIVPNLRILDRGIINLVPKQLTINVLQFPVVLEFPAPVTPDFPEFLDKGDIVVLVPPVPEIPTLINPIEPLFSERIIDPPFPRACDRGFILNRLLRNLVISQKSFTKKVELITIPTAKKNKP